MVAYSFKATTAEAPTGNNQEASTAEGRSGNQQ